MHVKNLNVDARLEILTDGSNKTGGAAIFLTIRRRVLHVQCSGDDGSLQSVDADGDFYYQEVPQDTDDGKIVARYNLSGIPTLTGRLSSDQSYKLLQNGSFNAVLVPSLVQHLDYGEGIMRGECIGGLPALFLNLIQSGYKIAGGGNNNNNNLSSKEHSSDSSLESERMVQSDTSYKDLSIIGPSGLNDTVDGLLDTMFGNVRRRPSLRLCEVPHDDGQWYEVYSDSYVCIWAQSTPHHDKSTTRSCHTCVSDSKELGMKHTGEYSLAFIVQLRSQVSLYNEQNHQSKKRQRTISNPDHSRPYSFGIITSSFFCEETCNKCGTNTCFHPWDVFRNLPQEVISVRKKSSFLLDFILHLKPSCGNKVHFGENSTNENEPVDPMRVEKRTLNVPSWIIDAKLVQSHLAVFPSDASNSAHHDEGLLIRAWHRSKTLHDALPFAFPLGVKKSFEQREPQIPSENEESISGVSTAIALKLSSCTSVALDGWGPTLCDNMFTFLSRSHTIRSRCYERSSTNSKSISLNGLSAEYTKDEFTDMVDHLKYAFAGETCNCNRCEGNYQQKAADDNEIDLDDSSCECNDPERSMKEEGSAFNVDVSTPSIDMNSAHLLFLGTGCATPSPHRSSSGIGLFMPTSTIGPVEDALFLSAIIECGEGTLSSLSKQIQSFSPAPSALVDQLSRVNFIWISHPHLDHYGDLSSVVQAVANAKTKTNKTSPVVVIAPSKVLTFLQVMLKSRASKNEDRQYIGVTHRDFQMSPFAGHIRSIIYDHRLILPRSSQGDGQNATKYYTPFLSIQNVEVEHCRDSYALLLDLLIPTTNGGDRFTLCFSGDTRPSAKLIKACSLHSSSMQRQFRSRLLPISLLIHEATFLDDSHGREDALRKRHSTVREALDVANSINAEACMLTHFSQRYSHVSVGDVCPEGAKHSFKGHWGIACDGMLIPLTKRGMAALLPLSKCIDAIHSNGTQDDRQNL